MKADLGRPHIHTPYLLPQFRREPPTITINHCKLVVVTVCQGTSIEGWNSSLDPGLFKCSSRLEGKDYNDVVILHCWYTLYVFSRSVNCSVRMMNASFVRDTDRGGIRGRSQGWAGAGCSLAGCLIIRAGAAPPLSRYCLFVSIQPRITSLNPVTAKHSPSADSHRNIHPESDLTDEYLGIMDGPVCFKLDVTSSISDW